MGGTGLGLAIVKHIAMAHGGRITVESVLGEGSVFRLHLPSPAISPEHNNVLTVGQREFVLIPGIGNEIQSINNKQTGGIDELHRQTGPRGDNGLYEAA